MPNPPRASRSAALAVGSLLAGPALAAGVTLAASELRAQEPVRDLATIFEPGALVADANGDGVADRVNAGLVMSDEPSVAEEAAAAEIAARLGFETMALDLPLARGTDGPTPVVVGRGGLAAAGVAAPVDPASLDSGEGVVSLSSIDGRPWIFVLGGDDEGLLAAGRLFAGVLPHTRTLSTAHLEEVREDLETALAADGVEDATVRLTQARALWEEDGIHRLVVEVEAADATAAADALARLASPDTVRGEEPDSASAI
ncbi:MAG TPA: hypothetical protein ENO23_04050, partial [Alphaproteobacteria bacterium]|nr:hypothetical protein [Alphaproteobacteria bacterium]